VNEDHVIIVTGAARGLGRAMALGLLQAGRRVVGADIASAAEGLAGLQAAAKTHGAADRLSTVSVDIRSVDSADALVAQTLERFGAVHGVVNNAGLGPYRTPGEPNFESKTFLDVPVDYWTALTDTNINGTFIMTRAVAPALIRAGWGRIVNITTSLTTMTMRGMAPYGPVKAALETSSALWAKDLADTGVTVNVLVPGGAADTLMVPVNAIPDREALLSPEIMVPPIVWLMSHASDGTTAKRIVAKHWRPDAPIEANLRASMAPAAWEA
jgi:NAD(P)-dependent dehydrogenase (short-subunit alcohol dehydrogenase family)